MKQSEQNTITSYSYLWDKENRSRPVDEKTHFEIVQGVIKKPIVQKKIGLEVGCGPGHDIEYMSRTYPDIRFIALDFNHTILAVSKRLKKYKNICFVRGSALDLPFKEGVFDFTYSFGVLHHTANPQKGMSEIKNVLKRNASVTLYLYENHEDNKVKYYLLKTVTLLRKVTTKLPVKILYLFCVLFSPVVFLFCTLPAKLLSWIPGCKSIANLIPFNFGRHPFHLTGDLYDRFATPIEIRYGKKELTSSLLRAGLTTCQLTKITDTAGLVVQAIKTDNTLPPNTCTL